MVSNAGHKHVVRSVCALKLQTKSLNIWKRDGQIRTEFNYMLGVKCGECFLNSVSLNLKIHTQFYPFFFL